MRLRSLCQIIGYNLETDKKFEICWFYFTLHRSTMSSPFYTSEPIDNTSPKWTSLEVPTLHATGLSTANGNNNNNFLFCKCSICFINSLYFYIYLI